MKNLTGKGLSILLMGLMLFGIGATRAQDGLTVSQIMNAIIAPMTNTLWGAYDIQTDDQWQELENAAVTVIAAGTLLQEAGDNAANADWQEYDRQMISAARAALTAIGNRDEEALFNAGNDQLYPPCESCHQRYMQQ
ncbi:MAG: hypothetical protein R3F41_16565 [Gammaproteobacteria bacterium]|nr:hypothetical protein [Pseudomonadales bacterium]